jgi:AraC family transcriptional regulator
LDGETLRADTLQDHKERLLRVLIYIQQNLDQNLSLETLAEVAHYSRYHFHRIFRGMVGESLHAHIRRIKLERAASRLRFTDQTVIDIAFDTGYETHEAFTRAFRAMTGLTPSAFRVQRGKLPWESAPSGVHYQPTELGDFILFESGGSKMDVKIDTVEPMRVAFVRHIGPYNECGKAWEKIMTYMGAKGWLGPGCKMLGVCYDDPEVTPANKIRYDACVTVEKDFQPEGDIGVQTLTGGEFAMTTHHGSYDKLGETYAKLHGQWMPRSGRTFRSAPCYEVYLNDPESTEPEELLTDIYAPLEPK